MSFNTWLDTLIEEKGINLDEDFEVQGASGTNYMTLETVIEHMKIAPKHEQEQIRKVLVTLDFKNQPIVPFFKHLAQAIAI